MPSKYDKVYITAFKYWPEFMDIFIFEAYGKVPTKMVIRNIIENIRILQNSKASI
jgi:hypothetical protein